MKMDNNVSTQHARFAAMFLDFENVYYYLRNQSDIDEPNDLILEMLRRLRDRLLEERNERCIVMKAYADFERISSPPLGSLYLLGVETHNVLGTEHKNAADMRLCIDALEILYTRPEISTFVFLAGDRDYIPLIQHLNKQAKEVLVVAFRGNVSGDLLQNVGERNFLDALSLLNEDIRPRIGVVKPPRPEAPAKAYKPAETVSKPPLAPAQTPEFNPIRRLEEEDERLCLEVMLSDFSQHSEIWLTPYLRKLTYDLPHLADFERKALVDNLEHKGVLRIEKRRGEPYDYSVIIVNWNHPDVQAMNPG